MEIVKLILLLISLQITYQIFLRNNQFENFENNNDRLLVKLQELVFSDTHIYKKDMELFNKYANLNQWKNVRVLDAGTGFGLHYKYLPKDIHKIGVDKDRLYLERAEIRNPTGKFKLGNLNDYKLFKFQEFTHINCMTDTLISNTLEDIDLIIGNFKYWLKKNGVLTIHIHDNIEKLDPAPRDFSMMYDNENDKLKHALTYFTKFTHDAVFKNIGEHVYEYVEKYIVKSGNSINKNTKYNILPKDVLIKKFIDNDFVLYKKIDLFDSGIEDYSLYFFKKNV
jgi:hypothetical protein